LDLRQVKDREGTAEYLASLFRGLTEEDCLCALTEAGLLLQARESVSEEAHTLGFRAPQYSQDVSQSILSQTIPDIPSAPTLDSGMDIDYTSESEILFPDDPNTHLLFDPAIFEILNLQATPSRHSSPTGRGSQTNFVLSHGATRDGVEPSSIDTATLQQVSNLQEDSSPFSDEEAALSWSHEELNSLFPDGPWDLPWVRSGNG
jgi:hypothetical protein